MSRLTKAPTVWYTQEDECKSSEANHLIPKISNPGRWGWFPGWPVLRGHTPTADSLHLSAVVFLSAPRPTAAAIGSPSRAAPRGRGRAGDGVGVRGRRGKPSGGCCCGCRQPLDLMRYRSDVGGQRPDQGRLFIPDAAGGALPWQGGRERRWLPAPGDLLTLGPDQRAHRAQAAPTK